ncbi:hypothetical protein NX059_012065 [Plenodomus lindquistii]|nr:hypothetical protein NX059_012065 [Plenodomus lindquistii]
MSSSTSTPLIHPSNQAEPDRYISCDDSLVPASELPRIVHLRKWVASGRRHIQAGRAKITSPPEAPFTNDNNVSVCRLGYRIFSTPEFKHPGLVPTAFWLWPASWPAELRPSHDLPKTLGVVQKHSDLEVAAVNSCEYNSTGLFAFGTCRRTFFVYGHCQDEYCPARHSPHTPAEIRFIDENSGEDYLCRYMAFYIPYSAPPASKNPVWAQRQIGLIPNIRPDLELVLHEGAPPRKVPAGQSHTITPEQWAICASHYNEYRTYHKLEDSMFDYHSSEWSSDASY